ncbi:hypothetical protein H4F38_17160 [Pectobacterium brasiliense]|uniref:hypothetical protein n=1 Tax=Pectobacterium brasiliense TaxID=180957 RepID=UPI00057E07C0|nr:hypothetical protein [Pectobacterium brasiliense]APS30187.1 hypothetical protein NC16_10800 [Pectobacterium brasiliense]KHS79569.1 hypothetical protein RC83_20940 [Pectobacterium brasiliense]KHT08354.1 hypothetical protein RC91_03830 [Pectobacterium brasiliense]MBN3099480.1 hypothetical protein [Pectobacterium brasiliense]MBN3102712.1 hypothetical protein [Pectobacterium brasiliense]
MEMLINAYRQILQGLNAQSFNLVEDKYSGIFLPIPSDEYWRSPVKVMLVGRETAGWNTLNGKNTMSRTLGLLPNASIEQVIEEAIERYKEHLNEMYHLKSRSRFRQYHFRLSRELGIPPQAIAHANLLAWDYGRQTPLTRPENEVQEVISASLKLLEAQIKHLEPNFIIFASGARRTDYIIKQLLTKLGGYETSSVISGKLWEFKTGNAICFRIAHPRAMREHKKYRDEVIERIKQRCTAGCLLHYR